MQPNFPRPGYMPPMNPSMMVGHPMPPMAYSQYPPMMNPYAMYQPFPPSYTTTTPNGFETRVISGAPQTRPRQPGDEVSASEEGTAANSENQTKSPSAQPENVVPPKQILIYVGNLTEKITDEFFEKILKACGPLTSWKRMRPKFGFADFSTAEGGLRAKTVLQGKEIMGCTLKVNISQKFIAEIENYEIEERKRFIKEKAAARLAAKQAGHEDEAGLVQDSGHIDPFVEKNMAVAREIDDLIARQKRRGSSSSRRSRSGRSTSSERRRDRSYSPFNSRESERRRNARILRERRRMRKERHNHREGTPDYDDGRRSRSRRKIHSGSRSPSRDSMRTSSPPPPAPRRRERGHGHRQYERDGDISMHSSDAGTLSFSMKIGNKPNTKSDQNDASAASLERVFEQKPSPKKPVPANSSGMSINMFSSSVNEYASNPDPFASTFDPTKLTPENLDTPVNSSFLQDQYLSNNNESVSTHKINGDPEPMDVDSQILDEGELALRTSRSGTLSRSRSRSRHRRRRRHASRSYSRSRSRSRGSRRKSKRKHRHRSRRDRESRSPLKDGKASKAEQIIKKVPKDYESLTREEIDWDVVTNADLIDKILRPWIASRIVEYLGRADAELTVFVVNLLQEQKSLADVTQEMRHVLADDVETFVVKLWRRFIYEMKKVQHGF